MKMAVQLKRFIRKMKKEKETVKEQVEDTQTQEQANEAPEAKKAQEAKEEEQAEAVKEPKLSKEESLQIDLAEAKDKYIRLYSEFENFRRRTSKEKLEMASTANASLMEALLPVLDDFERALKNMDEKAEANSMREGVELIQTKMNNILTQKGLKLMEVTAGDEFDADKHEAITQIPAPEEALKGKIVDVVEKGYTLGERVIRFAKVVTGA